MGDTRRSRAAGAARLDDAWLVPKLHGHDDIGIGALALVAGAVLESGQPGYDQEVAGFNAAVAHRADVVVGARSQEDVVQAVRFARARLRVAVQSTGHGAHLPVEAGLLVTTRRIDPVRIDVAARGATVGAGARWGAVVAPAAPHPGSRR